MQAAYADSHSHHDSHHNPSFHIEKGEGAVFVLLLQDTLCVLFIYLMKDESEKEEEDEAGLTDFEKPIMGCVKPVGDTNLKDINACYQPDYSCCDE